MAGDDETQRSAQLREPLRILSDLHLGHPASRIEAAEQLSGLLDGVATLVVNGDTNEQRCPAWRERADALWQDFQRLAESHGVDLVRIRGNHDPLDSELDCLELAGGAVFVTHGDALFRHISPWSPKVMRLRKEMDEVWADADEESMEGRFSATHRCRLLKPASRDEIDELHKIGPLMVPLRLLWPPQRVPLMLWSWWVAPGLAAEFCARFRPEARFVIYGHTHLKGSWMRGGRRVINTGGYVSIGSRSLVELNDGKLRVMKVLRDSESGNYRIGKQTGCFDL